MVAEVTAGVDEISEIAREWIPLGDCARKLGISRAGVYGRIKRGTLEARRGNRGGYMVSWPPPGHDGQGDVTLQASDQSRDSSVTVTALQAELAELRLALAKAEGETEAVRRQLAEVRETLVYERARAERLERAVLHADDGAADRKLMAELREMLVGLKAEAATPKGESVPVVTPQRRQSWWRRWVS
jgi:hypothetical protein